MRAQATTPAHPAGADRGFIACADPAFPRLSRRVNDSAERDRFGCPEPDPDTGAALLYVPFHLGLRPNQRRKLRGRSSHGSPVLPHVLTMAVGAGR
jgi:hypothetical protein